MSPARAKRVLPLTLLVSQECLRTFPLHQPTSEATFAQGQKVSVIVVVGSTSVVEAAVWRHASARAA